MNIKKRKELEQLIASGNLAEVFTGILHWNFKQSAIPNIVVDFAEEEHIFPVTIIAEKSDFVVFCATCKQMPNKSIRKKLEVKLTLFHYAHLLVVQDESGAQQWIYSDRRPDKPTRFIDISGSQPGLIVSKLQGLAFSIEDEEGLGIIEVDERVQRQLAQNAETVTRQFYEKFSKHLDAFAKFIEGISDLVNRKHYASLMLNRLMFIYFIQKRGYLDNDENYLRNRLQTVQKKSGENQFYKAFYRDFLRRLFHRLSVPKEDSPSEVDKLIGKVPYLNGGLFDEHQVEKDNDIDIADKEFKEIFDFFDEYQWYLDDSSNARANEINPDVIGHIFEKYINDREKMGAYYTKEDITGYIARNTILPALLQKAKVGCKEAFDSKSGTIWKLLRENPDDYIYKSVQWGCEKADSELPDEIRLGLSLDDSDLLKRRADWNKEADREFALLGETWRECIARRTRYFALKQKIKSGDIIDIADLTTHNLNIEKLTVETIERHEGKEFISTFYYAIAGRHEVEGTNIKERRGLTVLDPACGSGAFLFAALNVLQPLYEGCIARMYDFVEKDDVWIEKTDSKEEHKEYRLILKEVEKHPSEEYWICRNIILHNLFGVDIMPDAVEVAKLRLFLKLAAESEVDNKKPNMGLEPLPDIDFNIRAGNSLIGFASMAEFKDKVSKGLDISDGLIKEIEDEAQKVGMAYKHFVDAQAISHIDAKSFREEKAKLAKRLEELNKKLNEYLALSYGIQRNMQNKELPEPRFSDWKRTHRPFHWFVEFYDIIMENGGFDVVIGNPPYVRYNPAFCAKEYVVMGYETESCGDLYAFFVERAKAVIFPKSPMGMIIPVSAFSTDAMNMLMSEIMRSECMVHISNYDTSPSKLFADADQRLSIFLLFKGNHVIKTTNYKRWASDHRAHLMDTLQYADSSKKDIATIPKLGTRFDMSIWKKLSTNSILANGLATRGNVVYYHNSPRYWIHSTDYVPYFWNERDGEKQSTQVKNLFVPSGGDSSLCAVLNSSLFYWWFVTLSDGRHLNRREISNFRIDLAALHQKHGSRMSSLVKNLMDNFKQHAVRRSAVYKTTGEVLWDEIYPKHGKKIIDEIDKILAKHYGFTDEELDYIINYDYKFRMNRMGSAE